MEMFQVVAKTCNSKPSIEYSRKDLTKATAIFVASNLMRGFRQVDIINQDTGEIMLSNYVCEDFFEKELTPYATIELVEKCM